VTGGQGVGYAVHTLQGYVYGGVDILK